MGHGYRLSARRFATLAASIARAFELRRFRAGIKKRPVRFALAPRPGLD
jgi:hypothetical protein